MVSLNLSLLRHMKCDWSTWVKKEGGGVLHGGAARLWSVASFPIFLPFLFWMTNFAFNFYPVFSFLSLVNAWPQHLYCLLLLLHKGSIWALLKEDGFLDTAGLAAMEEFYLQKKTDCKY